MLGIQNPEINDELLELVEEADLDVDQRAKLEMELSKDIHIITAEPRLKTIAKDFVDHYSDIWTTGKAMFVCVNKVTCVRMYNYAQNIGKKKLLHWKRNSIALPNRISGIKTQNRLDEGNRDGRYHQSGAK